ncbi:Six-bladed beta-propeller, TolB-like [Plasmopara halstedii]|uniref:Six-bladed beta-propeller, TolB-like n=1 Tax=Plasmopara halstedii TaxID=4781 RepID=A0A0P1B4H4_PLAHL|nr:Six-bladed beta-propeller, TolB-like [Plasmopara halstedii]CEG49690.1 Six-bladed beta-propeller, TolB-like [Plasmopara halstedii]|eukprot:XP_024586059.1 Six-bladed beta-propeller, TolB-like [Plasmopara halstedii]
MAQDVIARVHLVAEKLQQKAQDAQKKGNEAAARSLTSSVSDLRQALALISEQRHLLALRHGESDDAIDDNMEELTSRLTKVQTMLIKKSEDMKVKGNVTARTALQQAAETVTQARMRILKQQQTLFGFSERWKMLETAGNYDTKYKNNEETLVERVQRLVELEHVVLEVWPEYEIEELKNAILRSREIENDMKRVKGRAKERQEEDAALLEQQREACQAMEQLVRESDQEIQHVTRKAAEERQTLKLKLESLTLENERLKHDHDEEIERKIQQKSPALTCLWKVTRHTAFSDPSAVARVAILLDCNDDTIPSWTSFGKCVAPVNATCSKLNSNAWGCVFKGEKNTTENCTDSVTPDPTKDTTEITCTDVSVEGDATYCIQGPICSGSGSNPTGSLCPVKGDIAVKDCNNDTIPSWTSTGQCVAPGPICSGSGSNPTGSLCPVKGDIAVKDCNNDTIPSWTSTGQWIVK